MTPRPTLFAFVSDEHTNSTVGLCPSQGVRLDEGGRYLPSEAQQWMWDCWLDYWRWIAALRARHKATLIIGNNGDALDGDHHQTSQIITRNIEGQKYIAHQVFEVPRRLKPARWYIIRGTVAHVGEGAALEEDLAEHLGAVQNEAKSWSAWHWRLLAHDVLIDLQHHCSVGGLPWTAPGAVARLAFRHWVEHTQRGERPAELVIRSHLHRHHDSYDAYATRAIVLPSWQLKTAHAHKVATESLADIGGIAVLVTPDRQYEVYKKLYTPELPAPEIIV